MTPRRKADRKRPPYFQNQSIEWNPRASGPWWVQGKALALLLCLSGCLVGPDYHRPAAVIAPHFKEGPPALSGWKYASPLDAAPKGPWWTIYNDPLLDTLEPQVAVSNQTLRADEAAFRIAVTLVRTAQASLYPTLTGAPGVTRSESGRNSSSGILTTGLGTSTTSSAIGSASTLGNASTVSSASTVSGVSGGSQTFTSTNYQLEGTADWEIDLWGRIRREIESEVANAQASAATLANAELSIQASLATAYFELRTSDALIDLLQTTVANYQRSLTITQNQYTVGVAARSDVITALTQLQGAQSQLINASVARAQYEHAIAVFAGRAPADLTIPHSPLTGMVPDVPVGLPGELLERRPDISSAERAMASENALIGEAIAAYYPTVTLSAVFGYSGDPIDTLIQKANRLWSLGAAASETLFNGGARTAAVQDARANYDEAVATYRGTVLSALQGVEDNLSNLRIYAQQEVVAREAVASSRQATQISINQYRAGIIAYTTVVTNQNIELGDEESLLTVEQDRILASVALVQALGGGWRSADLPSKGSLQRWNPLVP